MSFFERMDKSRKETLNEYWEIYGKSFVGIGVIIAIVLAIFELITRL